MTEMTDRLLRAVPFTVRADDDSDGLTLDGYGAVFDSPTRIDSWEGYFDEVIARGAFSKTLKERTPMVQFDHGRHPMVGSIPIAALQRAEEDAHGLHIVARLHDNWMTEPVREAIRSGSINGMSFAFNVLKESWDETGDVPLRTIHEVRLYEVGPVVWPAYEATSVGVRSLDEDLLADRIASTLTSRTPTGPGAADAGTPNRPGAADPHEPPRHSGTPSAERTRVLQLLQEQT